VLGDVSLTVPHGAFVSLLGASGSGKSTLLRLVAGLVRPCGGTVEVFGRAMSTPREDIAVMFQKPTLLPWMTVEENVVFPVRYRHGRVDAAASRRARDLIEAVGLADRADARPGALSGGMQQRVALARALVGDPKIVLLDEPFSALDELLRESLALQVRDMMREAGCTAVLVTHSIAEAALLSDTVFVLAGRPARIHEAIDVGLGPSRGPSTADEPAYARLCSRLRSAMRAHHGQAA